MDSINPLQPGFLPPESSPELPETFTNMPSIGDVQIPKTGSVKEPQIGRVDEARPLMRDPAVQAWGNKLCGEALFVSLNAWLDSDPEECQHAQLSAYSRVLEGVVQLSRKLIGS